MNYSKISQKISEKKKELIKIWNNRELTKPEKRYFEKLDGVQYKIYKLKGI
jgi:hypothetical protein